MQNYIKFFYQRIRRNQYGIKDLPSIANIVNIEHSLLLNVGDVLGPVICNWLLLNKGIDPMKKVKYTKHLMTVGSIIGRGRFDTTVWGSGILKLKDEYKLRRYKKIYNRKIDFRAVRGPLTRDIILSTGYSCPAVYGDPAVIMPLIYPGISNGKKYEVSVILHHRTSSLIGDEYDKDSYVINISKGLIEKYGIHFIDPKTEDYKFFINEILASKLIISSSLHGIILAEAYGVPAIFLNWGMDDQPTKFKDWYLSTDRDLAFCKSFDEAFKLNIPAVPDLAHIRNNLLDCFPYDLWEV